MLLYMPLKKAEKASQVCHRIIMPTKEVLRMSIKLIFCEYKF